jgi:hypothetical protein
LCAPFALLAASWPNCSAQNIVDLDNLAICEVGKKLTRLRIERVDAGLTHHSKLSGVEIGLRRVREIMLGCVMGLLVTVHNLAVAGSGNETGGAQAEARRDFAS